MKLILLIMSITISSCAVHPPVNPPQPVVKTKFIRLSQVDRDSIYHVIEGTYKKVTYDSTK